MLIAGFVLAVATVLAIASAGTRNRLLGWLAATLAVLALGVAVWTEVHYQNCRPRTYAAEISRALEGKECSRLSPF